MADIVNLRTARKRKARAADGLDVDRCGKQLVQRPIGGQQGHE